MRVDTAGSAIDGAAGLLHETAMRSRVREFMDLTGKSLTDLERACGVSRVTLVRSCKHGPEGIETCTLKTLALIAGALGVRARDLVDDSPCWEDRP